MEGISKEELRIQYEGFDNKPPIGFQIVQSNVTYLHSKGIVTNQIIGSTHYSFVLKCHQRTPNGLVILTVKMFLVNNYTSLSNSIELFESQSELKEISDYILPYQCFRFNKQDEVMNYVRAGYYRYSIDQMYKLNSSFKNQGVLNRFDLIKDWINQILEALSHLHERGQFHGGIKASNVFIDESVNQAKLVDFGFNAQQITMLHNTMSKDIYHTAVLSDRSITNEQRRFNDIYAAIILIYQMCFGFDNTFHVIKQLQQGITFSENDDDRDYTEDDYYEYKYRIIKLINKIVCKAALGTEEQRKKITITYIQDVLNQSRNVESFQNSPTNIAEMLQCKIAQKIALSSEKPLDLDRPSQDHIRDSNTNLDQEELYLEELIYQQKRNEEENNKQTQKQVYSNDNLSLQQKVDVYKKLDKEKYQKHSDSQKSSSNLSSGEKAKQNNHYTFEGLQDLQGKTVETMIFSDTQIEKEREQQYQSKSLVDPLLQESKLEELLKQHSKQKDSQINSQFYQNKEINIPSFTMNSGIGGVAHNHSESQQNYNFMNGNLAKGEQQNYQTNITQSTLYSAVGFPTQEALHTRFVSNIEQDYQLQDKTQLDNTNKSNLQSFVVPDEPSAQEIEKRMQEKQEDFWVIDLTSSRNVQRGTDYHPKIYQQQVQEAVSQTQPEVDDIYTQANKNSTTFVSIQEVLLRQLEPLNSQTQPNNYIKPSYY